MTNTDSPLDGILGSVIQEAIEYQAANDGEDTLTHARYLEESRKEAIAAINAYTTNKIIEARIDELDMFDIDDNAYRKRRINQLKDIKGGVK
jgi:hypothetical protein